MNLAPSSGSTEHTGDDKPNLFSTMDDGFSTWKQQNRITTPSWNPNQNMVAHMAAKECEDLQKSRTKFKSSGPIDQ